MAWQRKQSAIYTVGRKLEDGTMYIIDLDDLAPAGILIQAYKQNTSDRYTLSVPESELSRAGISRSIEDLRRLAESVDIYPIAGQVFINSRLNGISKPKIVPAGNKTKEFLQGIEAGNRSLPELLTTGLSELCKVKPEGLDAVRWLGNWLIENNPSKPTVGDADNDVEEIPAGGPKQ